MISGLKHPTINRWYYRAIGASLRITTALHLRIIEDGILRLHNRLYRWMAQ